MWSAYVVKHHQGSGIDKSYFKSLMLGKIKIMKNRI